MSTFPTTNDVMNKIGCIPKGCGLNKISLRYSSLLWLSPQARRDALIYFIYSRNALEIIIEIGSEFRIFTCAVRF